MHVHRDIYRQLQWAYRLHHTPGLVKHHKKKFGDEYATNGGGGVLKQAAGLAAHSEMSRAVECRLIVW